MKNLVCIAFTAFVFTGCGNDNAAEQARLQQQRSVDSMTLVMQQQQAEIAHQRAIDSMNAVVAAKEEETRAAKNSRVSRSSNSTTYVQSNAGRAEAAAPAEAKRKGWSGAAKGAAIGAGVGALSGALIDDKKGRGAIIGGVAGAGIGAGTGAIIDGSKKKK